LEHEFCLVLLIYWLLCCLHLGNECPEERHLTGFEGEDPLILTLAGNYCPKEHRQHRELASFYPNIAVA
jgi:hypothetical protein